MKCCRAGCEGLPTFRELTPSPSSGYAGGLVVPKLMPFLRGHFWASVTSFEDQHYAS